MKRIFILMIGIFLMCGCEQSARYQTISLSSAKNKIKEGAYLVDVRTKQEYKQNHIQGAINIPLDEISNQKRKIISKNDVIIVYCYSGGRSKQAAKELISMGYQHVYDFGSIKKWIE